MIRLLITGEPSTITAQQKGVNWKAQRFYTKTAIKAEKRRIKRNLHFWTGTQFVPLKAHFPTQLDGPLQVSIKYVFPLTQELASKHADKLSDSRFETRHGKRPDFDNSLKLLLDILTEIKLWHDDGQIDIANVHKCRGTEPKILVAAKELGD